MQTCQDNFFETFSSYPQILETHERLSKLSKWQRCKIDSLKVVALESGAPLSSDLSKFAAGTSTEAVEDTVKNLGLAIWVDGELYPVRDTAYKTLLDRAKINGTALPKLSRKVLAEVLNACLNLFQSDALVLVRDEKVAAVHAGDSVDYSVLPINELLKTIQTKLDSRFPGNEFDTGYADHSITSGTWKMPGQKEDLLGTYVKTLKAGGKNWLADKLVPGIRFVTSDTGVASAKVSALLMGAHTEIHIGGCIAVDHRHNATVENFEKALDQLFAQFGDRIKKLEKLIDIRLDYPVNAMTRICKKFSMPKKAAVEAIKMFEMAIGNAPATAHDVFMALQEIMFILRSDNTPESKLLEVEENLARALSIKWSDFDLAKGVEY